MNTIQRLKELHEKATPGPWRISLSGSVQSVSGDHARDGDGDLVVAMRNALPQLLAVAEAAQVLLECKPGDPEARFVHRHLDLRQAVAALDTAVSA
jgi:hypothetical protein